MTEASGATGRGPRGRVGTVINGKWTVDARIGSGGMATVYAATHRNGRRVAIKMLHAELSRDEPTRARFLREGYVANAVGHPGIVHVEDDGLTEDGAAFLVLDLLEGDTVEARRTRFGGAMPVDEVLEIADQALDALAAAHDKGIIHRDVKPENVFVCTSGKVKLLDFGLARMKDAQTETTKTGTTIGTPAFMPPEQARGDRDDVDARSDVWGLGATLYTALTGAFVHDADTLHEQLVANATLRPRSVRELAPHVSPSVAVVIDRALELAKNDRWESAGEMQRALRAARVPRSESDHFLLDSLTLPAASLRAPAASAAAGAPVPTSGPRTARVLDAPLPKSDETLRLPPPSSDPTIQEKVPPATEVDLLVVLDGLPSSDEPFTPKPITERLSGTRPRQPHSPSPPQSPQLEPPPSPAQHAQHAHHPQLARHPPLITSGPAVSGIAPRGSGSLLPSAPHLSASHASSPHASAPQASASHASALVPSGPPEAPPPSSLRQRRAARTAVMVSFVLIAVCALAATWVLMRH